MTEKTRRDQRIEHVAAIIRENLIESPYCDDPAGAARDINCDVGWSYDVRWCDGDYTDDKQWSHLSNDKLSDEMLDSALRIAGSMEADR